MQKHFRKIYLDYAASTPVAPEVLKAMQPYWSEKFGNPGSLHSFGQEAIAALDKSREKVARIIGAQFREIIFTSGATEANNLALRGAIKAWREGSGKDNPKPPRLIVSAIEHESVLETARDLAREGVDVVFLPVGKKGLVNPKDLSAALDERTVLVSIMYGNNEVGTIQPIQKIGRMIQEYRNRASVNSHQSVFPLFHSDMAQTFLYLPAQVRELGVDCATFSGHKMYSSKGIGALYFRNLKLNTQNVQQGSVLSTNSYLLAPMLTGGGQEFGFRSGTENVPLVVGFAKAMELAERGRGKESVRMATLKQYFLEKLRAIDMKILVNGSGAGEGLPHILNLALPFISASDLLVYLDLKGVAIGTGSACQARSPEPSHVLQAMGVSKNRAERSVRFSFGNGTTKGEIDTVVRLIKDKFHEER